MPGPLRSTHVAFVAGGLAGLLACSAGAPARSCAAAEDCPAGARCVSTLCVANAPPAASVTVPAAPIPSHAVLSFDASGSTDPDAGDAVVAFAWTFRALSGQPCAPPVAASTGPAALVRFGCAGRYAVDVTATDGMGASAVATEEFDVVEGPALLEVGPDLVVDHACTAAPRCAPAAPVALQASAPGIPAGQVTFAWTVEPPADRPLSPSRRVTLSPSSAAAAPTVAIETDGDAISGDWIFRVEARDAWGVIGGGAVRVSVLNRAPVVAKTITSPAHAFDGSQFTASGEVPFTVSDPDGDPLGPPSFEWRHAGDGSSTFGGVVLAAPARATFAIAVPYATPGDALLLIGGAGLERTISFAISDVNGARTAETWPIVVGNRPPRLETEPAPFTVAHTYDAAGQAYVADAPLSTWSDPDGDPLRSIAGMATGDPVCPEVVVEAGAARARCRLAYAGTPAAANFAGSHTVAHSVQDPWAAADRTSTVTFTIGNRPPAVTSSAPIAWSSDCGFTTCCNFVAGEGCYEWKGDLPSTTASVPSRWSDPDGDPLGVDVEGSRVVCVDATCTALAPLPAMAAACGIVTQSHAMTVSDGELSTSAALLISRECWHP